MKWVALVLVVTTTAVAYAFRLPTAGTAGFWWGLGAPYAALAALAVYRLWDDGTLAARLAPRFGDLSLGSLVAIALLLGTWAGRSLLAPAGTAEHAWVFRIYLQLGDTEGIQRSLVLTGLILGVSVCEELVWRGLVLHELSGRFGTRVGWLLSSVLYAVSLSPTVVTLADPIAGPNPLLMLAALGCGLFWSFTTRMTGRLPPAAIAHAIFAYFTVMQFHLPGM